MSILYQNSIKNEGFVFFIIHVFIFLVLILERPCMQRKRKSNCLCLLGWLYIVLLPARKCCIDMETPLLVMNQGLQNRPMLGTYCLRKVRDLYRVTPAVTHGLDFHCGTLSLTPFFLFSVKVFYSNSIDTTCYYFKDCSTTDAINYKNEEES